MTTPTSHNPTPAQSLLGLELQGEDHTWLVESSIEKPAGATGGHFSVSYQVRSLSDGQAVAFLKALDLSPALQAPNPTARLQAETSAYEHEKKLVLQCRSMSRVVTAIDHGTYRPADSQVPVPFLVFEKADGDLRAYRQMVGNLDLAWEVRSLHNVTVALAQVHGGGIAHQDLKPSNVMVFGSGQPSADESKVGDFGRASTRDGGPWDGAPVPGDRSYAPIEHLYGELSNDWNVRRRAGDLYQLANLGYFYFTAHTLSAALFSRLDEMYHWQNWEQSYREVLPHVRDAFDKAMSPLEARFQNELGEIPRLIRYLGDPDPLLRGHPTNRQAHGSPYDLQRFVSKFDLFATKLERKLIAGLE